MRVWIVTLIGLVASWVVGCSDDATQGSGGAAGTGGTAGAGGDTGVVVFIPEGASEDAVEASVRELDASGFPNTEDLVAPVFDIGPSGTEFAVGVTVGIPIDPDTPAGTTIEVVRFDDASGEWEPLGGTTIIGAAAFAQTDHFSVFSALGGVAAAACDNLWTGGPGTVPPLHTAGGLTVVPGVKTSEDIAFSGPSEISLGSTWESESCSVTVSGNFGPGLVGDGAWTDYSNAGGGGNIPQSGAYSFLIQHQPPNDPRGPYLGLSDPCHAPLGAYPYNLNINFAANCIDRCAGVTCQPGNDPCATVACNPVNGLCEPVPNAGTCGSSNAGRCIQGMCIVEVQMGGGASGDSVCAAEGLTCDSVPVMNPPEAACIAFNPTATVSADINGWEQGVYCDDNMGKACEGRINDCHSCPACNAGLVCTIVNSDLIERLYARCVP